MFPKVYDPTRANQLAILNNITANVFSRQLNKQYVFDFKCFEKELKTEFLVEGNLILVEDFFDIRYIGVSHDLSGKTEYDIKCEHVFYRLLDEKRSFYAFTGTAQEILEDLLDGTDFSVGIVKTTSSMVFAVNQNGTVMSIILQLATSIGVQIGFSDQGFTINLVDSIGQNNGYEIKVTKNIQGISKVRDLRGDAKTSYKVDVVNIYQSNNLKDLGLEDLEKVRVGDIVHVVDETINVDTYLAVLEIREDILKNTRLDVTLDSNFDTLMDIISNVTISAITTDDTTYGITLNNEVGLQAERYDKLAKSVFNAQEISMYEGDGAGNYTPAIYFDAVARLYRFNGNLNATGTISAGVFIGGSVIGGTITGAEFNNGDDTFIVDEDGNLTAENANIKGTIESSNIIGSTIKDQTETTSMFLDTLGRMVFSNPSKGNGMAMDAGTTNKLKLSYVDGNDHYPFLESIQGYTFPKNIWNFSDATIQGLNITVVFG